MKNKNQLGRLAFRFHSWLGLISGIFLLLLGLSGSAIVFMKEIDKTANHALLTVTPASQTLPLDSLYRIICRARPRLAGITWLNPDARADEAYDFRLYQNDGKLTTYDLGLMSIDPYTGTILREGNLKEISSGFIHWMLQFHWSFQLGIPGLLLATLFGITMILSTLTGIIIYRKQIGKVLSFSAKLKWNNWRTRSASLHRIIGVWTILINIIIFFTGFWMNKFSLDTHYWHKQTIACPPNTLSEHNIDSMYRTARLAMPDLIVTKVYLPTQPGKTFRVIGIVEEQSSFFSNGNEAAIDPVTGHITTAIRLQEKTLGARLEATVFPLHAGTFGGIFVKVVYVLLGLIPGLLSITGAILWFRRKA